LADSLILAVSPVSQHNVATLRSCNSSLGFAQRLTCSADSVTKKSCASAFSEEDEGTVIAFFKKAETIVDLMSSMKGGATLPEFEALKVLWDFRIDS
jgi:DNA-binding transcriptional regulator WhiA